MDRELRDCVKEIVLIRGTWLFLRLIQQQVKHTMTYKGPRCPLRSIQHSKANEYHETYVVDKLTLLCRQDWQRNVLKGTPHGENVRGGAGRAFRTRCLNRSSWKRAVNFKTALEDIVKGDATCLSLTKRRYRLLNTAFKFPPLQWKYHCVKR